MPARCPQRLHNERCLNARLDCHLGFVQRPEIFLFVKYFWSRLLYRVCSVAAAVTQSCAIFLAQNRLLDGFCSVLLYYVMLSLSQLVKKKSELLPTKLVLETYTGHLM